MLDQQKSGTVVGHALMVAVQKFIERNPDEAEKLLGPDRDVLDISLNCSLERRVDEELRSQIHECTRWRSCELWLRHQDQMPCYFCENWEE